CRLVALPSSSDSAMKYGYSVSTLFTSATAAWRSDPATVPGPSTEATRGSWERSTSRAPSRCRLFSKYGADGLWAVKTSTMGSDPNVFAKLEYAWPALEPLPT